MKNKKQILTTLLSVLLPVFLVSAVVYATTTVGDNVDVGGTLDVTGATVLDSTLSVKGNVTLGDAAGDTITITGTPTFAATTTFSKQITLANGESIANATDGTITLTGKALISASRISTSTGYENFLEISGDITNATGGAKTYGLLIELTRPADAPTYGGDIDDAGLKIRVITQATTIVAGNTLRGMDVEAKTKSSGTVTNLNGANITANSDGSGGVSDQYGLKVESKGNQAVTDSAVGLYVRMFRQAGTPPTAEYAIKVQNSNTSGTGIDAGLVFISESEGVATTTYDYGIDMNSAKVNTADIRLSNGEIISNVTDGTVAISGNLTIASSTTYTVAGTSPGTQVKLMYEASGVTTGSWGGINLSVTHTLGASGGITGAEFKARANTTTTVSGTAVSSIRGAIITADAKYQNVTQMQGIEANIASGGNINGVLQNYTGTITTAYGLLVTQQLTHLGDHTYTSVYGISIQADNVDNTADIQLSGGHSAGTARPQIRSGAGAPTGTCVNGSMYLNSSATASSTAIYVCVKAGWEHQTAIP